MRVIVLWDFSSSPGTEPARGHSTRFSKEEDFFAPSIAYMAPESTDRDSTQSTPRRAVAGRSCHLKVLPDVAVAVRSCLTVKHKFAV